MTDLILFIFCILVAYLTGSVNSAIIVSRIFELPDPTTEGSKNPGATNIMRLSGKKYGVLVLIVDILKGLLPVLLARFLGAGIGTVALTAFAAVVGHMYPAYFSFKGGKGVATMMGGLLGLHFILGIFTIATWIIIAKFSRYASLASIVSAIFMTFYSAFLMEHFKVFIPLMFIAILILYKHRQNISRLLDGTESKLKIWADKKS